MLTLLSPGSEAQDALVAALQAALPTLDGVAMTWQPCHYYLTQAVGWHPRAEYVVSLREGGGYIACAAAPTYRPAWLDSFSVHTEGEDLAEIMAALVAKVDAKWRLFDETHKAKQQEQE